VAAVIVHTGNVVANFLPNHPVNVTVRRNEFRRKSQSIHNKDMSGKVLP
jgi:hypothetical protein